MKSFAVFDIDGTLIRWQLYHALVNELAKSGLLGEDALGQLKSARRKWKLREHSESFRDYESSIILQYEAALPTLRPADVDKLIDTIISEYGEQVYTFSRSLLNKLKAEGYLLFAISGSQTELIKRIAMHYGFDDFSGTTYVRKANSFTGKKLFPAKDKSIVLKNLVKKHQASYENSYGIGDSRSDAGILELVENPIAFNPDRSFLEVAKRNNWPIVIERKNVVYRLETHDGQYHLV